MTLSRQERHKAGRYPIVQRSSGVAARSASDSDGQGASHQRDPEPSTVCTCGAGNAPGAIHSPGGIDPNTMEPVERCPLFRFVPVSRAEAWRFEQDMGVAPTPRR